MKVVEAQGTQTFLKKREFPASPWELLDKQQIAQNVHAAYRHYLDGLVIFDEIDSTNAYLLKQAKEQLANWQRERQSEWQHKQNDATNLNLRVANLNLNGHTNHMCLAESQTAGRGRLGGKKWFSPYARNIYLSLLWYLALAPDALGGLGIAVAVAVVQALQRYVATFGMGNVNISDVRVKWPNDVMWNQRKLAGILIEMVDGKAIKEWWQQRVLPQASYAASMSERCEHHEYREHRKHVYGAIIGVGMNVNMPREAVEDGEITQAWCDVMEVINAPVATNALASVNTSVDAGIDVDAAVALRAPQLLPQRNELAGLLIDQLLTMLITYQEQGLAPFLSQWTKLDMTRDQEVTVITSQQQEIIGVGRGIDARGRLLLERRDVGVVQAFASGEVSLRCVLHDAGK